MNDERQMYKDGWVKIGAGRWIRKNPKSGWDARWDQPLGKSLEAKADIRKATHEDPKLLETTTGSMRMRGTMPSSLHAEMLRECGEDPEKQESFMRDWPEHLFGTPRQVDLPAKKTYFRIQRPYPQKKE